jgi:predicted permease
MSRFMPTLYGANRQLGVVVTPDAGVLLFSVAITLLTGVVFGCLPALRSTRIAPIAAIKQAASGRARTGFAADKLLVALQAALSVGLVIVAGLFVRTISNLRTAPLGYEPGGLLYARIEPRTGGITQPQRADFFEHARQRLERVPGVIAATATDNPPLGRAATIFLGGGTGLNVCTPGFVPANPQDAQVGLTTIGPRYFETLRMRIVAGRELTWADASGGPDLPPVGIVNEAFARKFFAGKDPLDQRFGFSCPSKPDTFRVIGVVADSRNLPRQQAGPTVYLFMGGTANVVTLIARTAGRPESMIPAVRRAITDLNASVPTFGEITPIELREQQMQQERLLTNLLFAFGTVALLLSSIGIYGMLAYMVSRRTSEIGLRMALGAQRRDVVAMVIRESVVPVAGGLAAGAAAALMTARWIDSLLFEVSAYDPWTLAASAAVFLTIAAAAAIVPARRASLVDPLRALRTE